MPVGAAFCRAHHSYILCAKKRPDPAAVHCLSLDHHQVVVVAIHRRPRPFTVAVPCISTDPVAKKETKRRTKPEERRRTRSRLAAFAVVSVCRRKAVLRSPCTGTRWTRQKRGSIGLASTYSARRPCRRGGRAATCPHIGKGSQR
jgi:hypothetical protein